MIMNSQSQSDISTGPTFYSHIQDSPNLEGQVPVFISPRISMARLYSLFIASYNTQGYSGDIRLPLHTGGLWIVAIERKFMYPYAQQT
jgi:hypothetical protein